jgi:hypothetical protein
MNTGSILNRINFGLAAAGGRVPGITVAGWPEATALAVLPREQQVDGVIRTLLGGSASPDTRDVLLTGTNPFLQSKTVQDTRTNQQADRRAERVPLARQQQQAGRAVAKPGQGQSLTQAIGVIPNVTGLAQIVGLALGAPEFQRR